MAFPRYHTGVFDALTAVYSDIAAVEALIPEHPNRPGKKVTVLFGNPEDEPTNVETIHVVQRVTDDEEAWSRMPGGKDEELDIRIIVGTYWEDRTGQQVLDRLKTLVHFLDDIWRDLDTGEYTPPGAGTYPQFQKLQGRVSTDVELWPNARSGYVGKATMRMRIVSRI